MACLVGDIPSSQNDSLGFYGYLDLDTAAFQSFLRPRHLLVDA